MKLSAVAIRDNGLFDVAYGTRGSRDLLSFTVCFPSRVEYAERRSKTRLDAPTFKLFVLAWGMTTWL